MQDSDQYEEDNSVEDLDVRSESEILDDQADHDDIEDHDTDNETDDSEPEPVKTKKPGYVEIKDPAVKARVDQLSREKHENFRKAESESRRADALARELEELKRPGPPKEVKVPDADPITQPDLYVRQQQERERYIRDQVKYESDAEVREQSRKQTETQKRSAMVDGYKANMDRLKLAPEVMQVASDTCAKFGITGNHPLIDELLEDKDGPAIVKYLHDNQEHLAEIASMRPAKAFAYIEREIRNKLKAKPASKAPPPPTKMNGTRKSDSDKRSGRTYS